MIFKLWPKAGLNVPARRETNQVIPINNSHLLSRERPQQREGKSKLGPKHSEWQRQSLDFRETSMARIHRA